MIARASMDPQCGPNGNKKNQNVATSSLHKIIENVALSSIGFFLLCLLEKVVRFVG